MDYFWIGIVIFSIGYIIRIAARLKYVKEYKEKARTPLSAQELKSKYRPKIFIGLLIMVVGCLVTAISAFG